MFRRKSETAPDRRCSFCHKAEDVVHQLVSNPSDYARAFICDECVAVCYSTMSEDREQSASQTESTDDAVTRPPFRTYWGGLEIQHPRAPELVAAMSTWVAREARGLDASKELAEVRRLAMLILPHEPGKP
jgi:hypothetical protein